MYAWVATHALTVQQEKTVVNRWQGSIGSHASNHGREAGGIFALLSLDGIIGHN